MIQLDPSKDWGPPLHELTRICNAVGCKVVLSHELHDGTRAYEIECPGHQAKVNLLATLAEYDARDPDIILIGEKIASAAGGEPEDIAALVQKFVQANVRFLPEPREKFQPTGRTLALGVGDCDCSARATMALLRAAGLRAGLQTLGTPPRHVAAAVQLGGSWRWLDTSIAALPGEHPVAAAKRLGLTVRSDITGEGQLGQQGDKERVSPSVPNMITIAGFGMGLAWVAGKSDLWGVLSIVADEADGWVARELGEATEFGSLLDWSTDLALTPLVWRRVGLPWRFLPLVTTAQIAARHYEISPRFGSFRAALMVYQMLKNRIASKRKRRR